MQISYIPSSIGDSVVQLNQSDCLWKLGQDLLYLFVYRPTADFMMTVSELVGTYPICYGRTLVPAIYAFKKIALLLASKQVAKIVKVCVILCIKLCEQEYCVITSVYISL